MTRPMVLLILVAMSTCVIRPVCAQNETQEDLERLAAEQELNARVQRFVDMGLEPEVATFMAILSETGMSPAEILMFMMMADKGGEDVGGLMLLMNAMRNAAAAQPVVVDRGEQLLIVEDGVLYVIDMTKMEVAATLPYAKTATSNQEAIWQYLIPVIARGGEQAGGEEAEQCRRHLKLLAQAIHRYAQAHGGALPGQNWVDEIAQYLENQDVLRCPARPELAVGYAMNDKLIGALMQELVDPERTVLLFETTLDAANPAGGPEAVPAAGVHEDGINVLFLNGVVEWMPVAEARELLDMPVLR